MKRSLHRVAGVKKEVHIN